MKNNIKVKRMSVSALFIALILVQNFIPFTGYITFIPGMPSISIIQVTIIIAAIIMGKRFGLFLGIFWGLLSFIVAWTSPVDLGAIFFRNLFVAFIPRALVGYVSGWLYEIWVSKKKLSNQVFGLMVVGGVGSSVNTIGFIFFVWISTLFGNLGASYAGFENVFDGNVIVWLITTVVGLNGIIEIFIASLLVSIIGIILIPIAKKQKIMY